jgi:hypothetical protein
MKMSKSKKTEKKQPSFLDILEKDGFFLLTAKTREELAEKVNDIPADIKYGVGAVGYNHDTREFTLRVDIV